MKRDEPSSWQTERSPPLDGSGAVDSSDLDAVHLQPHQGDLVLGHLGDLVRRGVEGFPEGLVGRKRMVNGRQLFPTVLGGGSSEDGGK